MRRVIRPEILDDSDAEYAAPSVRDLIRLNRYFGGYPALRAVLPDVARPGETFSVLDVGAASGDMGAVIRRARPGARVTSLDYRVDHLRGAAPPVVVADAFQLPFAGASFDVVFCSLFLHHFEAERVIELLRAF